MKDVFGFNSRRSGPLRPLLLMISGRASAPSTRRSFRPQSHPCRETSNFFPRCCLTVYKIFFSETFIFQEIVHFGKESKTTAFQITNGISTNKRKIVFSLYTLCEEQYRSFIQTVFSIDFHLDLNVPCLRAPPPPTPNFKFCITVVSNFSWVLQSSQEKSMIIDMQNFGE